MRSGAITGVGRVVVISTLTGTALADTLHFVGLASVILAGETAGSAALCRSRLTARASVTRRRGQRRHG